MGRVLTTILLLWPMTVLATLLYCDTAPTQPEYRLNEDGCLIIRTAREEGSSGPEILCVDIVRE